jgi:CRP-like cAMP-binding protein
MQVSIFKDAESEFLHKLTLSLKPLQFYQNQTIIKKGDKAKEMFFLVKGTVHVLDDFGSKVFATFEPGSFFGEIGLFMKNGMRTATLKCASADAVVFKCEKQDLDKILEGYPEMKKKIEVEIERRFEYIKHRETANVNGGSTAMDAESIREKLKKVTWAN